MTTRSVVALRDVSFKFDSSADPLFSGLSVSFSRGFSGIVGANGVGKSTLLQLIAGVFQPEGGVVQAEGKVIYCDQRTDDPPAELSAFLQDTDGEACALRGRLSVEDDFPERWSSLSHGERKRTQIAVALWRQPDVLAIDEPTNHIDSAARKLLIENLQRYRGVGLIVSHDRDLLDQLCQSCLWLEPPDSILYKGGYSQAREQRELERETSIRARDQAKRERHRLNKEMIRRRDKADSADSRKSKRHIGPKDHAAKGKIDLAIYSGKDGQAGRVRRQIAGRLARADAELAARHVDKEYAAGLWLPGSRAPTSTLLFVDAGAIPLGPNDGELRFPSLHLQRGDRVAITGNNGAGKSTLVDYLLSRLVIPEEKLLVIPQELGVSDSQRVLEQVKQLPAEKLGHVMTVVSRLGSRPNRLLESERLSPGELRKLMLALGVARSPYLIVMDEPTNHLDLPSIEALELALQDCPCGLLLVSHDQAFLDNVANRHWRVVRGEAGSIVTVDRMTVNQG